MTEWPLALFGMLTSSLLFAMVMGGQNTHNLPDYLEKLRVAEHLDDSAVGFAAKKTETFQAFERAYAERKELREEFEWLIVNASPAGRIYAAILLGKIDEEAGQAALESLQNSHDAVEYRSGDIFESRTVGDLASAILQGETIIIFPPSMR